MKKILLVGNPNVGKSVLFSRLTGVDVISSNYPGTTVEFTKGYLKLENETYEVFDIPGTYTLQPTTKAEEVALKMLEEISNSNEDFIIVNVVDSTNLERNLNLTLQIIEKKLPIIVALNFWDEVKHKGIVIDYQKLEEILEVPVVPICARSGEGIKDLIQKFNSAKISNFKVDLTQKWAKIGEIVEQVQIVSHRHHSFLDRLSEISIRPSTGIPMAVSVLLLSFFFTRILAENMINFIFDPLFNNLYLPLIKGIISRLTDYKLILDILLGTTPTPMESFGILTTGLYIPFVVVLPYIIAFYTILGILEDTGYLPRLAVMFDSFLHKLGVHGYSSVPILLGFGCKVSGILATRILETEREKIIATALVLMLAPCMPQTAMIISLILPFGVKYVFLTLLIIFINGILTSFILNKLLTKTETPELFLEIPPYRMLHLSTLLKKLFIRIKQFITDAVPLIIVGIIFINIFEVTGINRLITNSIGKITTLILNLPKETSSIIILGFLRKEVSIALLTPFNLNIKQMIVASIFMTLYLPCISTFFVLLKELGIKNTALVIAIMFIGGIIFSFLVKEIFYLF